MSNRRRVILKLALFCLFTGVAVSSSAHIAIFGPNQIFNGDAETGPASPDGSQVVAVVPGWTTNGEFNVVSYNTSGGFPLTNSPGPANRGTNFFCGGQNDAISTGTQIVDVSFESAAIDSGRVTCNLSGYLGGFSSQDDNATLTAVFSNSVPATIGSISIGPVLAADRTDITGLLFRQTNSFVPPGTRSIRISLVMTREEGSFNDGYADNLSLVFSLPFTIRQNGNSGTVSWVTNSSYNHLQSNTNLAQSAAWTAWPGPVAFDGTNFTASLGLTNAQRYFRLASP